MARAHVVRGAGYPEEERSTAEIFCATSESDLWQSVRDLRDHHLRDLYRSLLEVTPPPAAERPFDPQKVREAVTTLRIPCPRFCQFDNPAPGCGFLA